MIRILLIALCLFSFHVSAHVSAHETIDWANPYTGVSAESRAEHIRGGQRLAILSAHYMAAGPDQKYSSLLQTLRDDVTRRPSTQTPQERLLFHGLALEVELYESIGMLSATVTTEGLRNLGKPHEAARLVMEDIFVLFSHDYVFAHSYESASFASLVALKALEERYPLNILITHLNTTLVLRAFENLRRWPTSQLGPHTIAFLKYLLRFRPHLHPYLGLMASALLADAQSPDRSSPPSPRDLLDYVRLKDFVALQVAPLGTNITPHVLYGDVLQERILVDEARGVAYLDQWMIKHKRPVTDWSTIEGVTGDVLAQHQINRLQTELHHSDCEGFLF